MRPAPSLIAFSTLSGLGFGLLAWLGLGFGPTDGWAGAGLFALGLSLALIGLAASALHLGHPERAWRAFTQWRSSWLSREAWLTTFALIATAAFAATGLAPLGWLAALLCLGAVGAAAMVHASLATVPRWHHWSVPALHLAYAVTGGALLAGQREVAMAALALLAPAQILVWWAGDRREARDPTTTASATGLGPGRVRPFAAPHTGPSYLTDEMAFRVARRHATRLRALALILGMALPLALLALSGAVLPTALAALCHLAGALCQRWLFFAEARHVMARHYA